MGEIRADRCYYATGRINAGMLKQITYKYVQGLNGAGLTIVISINKREHVMIENII